MTTRKVKTAAMAVLLSAGMLLPSVPALAQQRPNIVFLYSDDHAAHAVSAYRSLLAYGAPLPPTPNIDRLAADGMLFRNAFVTNSICGPARAAVLTGQYGHLTGVMTNHEPLHPTHTTFPKLLRAAGYETVLFGKWHLKSEPAGFDHYEVLTGQGPYYNPVLHSATDTTRHQGYTQDVVTDRAIDWMRGRASAARPFLLMLHYNATHRYWDPGPAELELYRDSLIAEPATFWDDGSGRVFPTRAAEMTIAADLFDRDLKLEAPAGLTPQQQAAWDDAYAGENAEYARTAPTGDALTRWRYQRYIQDYMRVVTGLDRNVGRFLDALDRAGLADNTVVVYTSDQGFFLGDHGWFDKRWMYEESLRTPLLVRWPGTVPASAVNTDLVMNIDLAETLLEIGGAAVPTSMQGRSLVPLLKGGAPADWRDAIYYQYFEYPDWHMVRRQYGVRTHRYKLIHYYEAGQWELFDLDRDPDEMRSLYGDPSYADVVERLKRRLAELRREYEVPDHDPVPYRPVDIPVHLRRTGSTSGAPAGWWRGNLHTHSLWSDGEDFPEAIVAWYKERGYNFIAFTEHDMLQEGERWLDVNAPDPGWPPRNASAREALPAYRSRFGTGWVQERREGDSHLVRLRPVAEYRGRFEEPGRFLLISGEEITDRGGAHINAFNLSVPVLPLGGVDAAARIRANVAAVAAQRARQGRLVISVVNHPNYVWALTAEDLAHTPGVRFFELFNGHLFVNNEGDALRPGTERMWDIALALRSAARGDPLYALATDDAHHYTAADDSVARPGRGWVMVRSSRLHPDSLMTALEAGDFYASTGVTLTGLRRDPRGIRIEIEAQPGVEYRTLFIGTRRSDPVRGRPRSGAGDSLRVTLDYGDGVGEVLAEVEGAVAEYTFRGDERYVRAKVVSSRPHVDPTTGRVLGRESAWVQPVMR